MEQKLKILWCIPSLLVSLRSRGTPFPKGLDGFWALKTGCFQGQSGSGSGFSIGSRCALEGPVMTRVFRLANGTASES